jgi:hypothetical protein
MHRKQLIGWISIALGIALIVLAVHSMHEFAEKKGVVNDINRFFTHNPLWNPLIKFFGGTPQVKALDYDVSALITQVFGFILVGFGGIVVYLSRRKNKKTK